MRRKAILLTIRPDNAEMEELIFAQGSQLIDTIRQKRQAPDPQYHLGSGKLEEARERMHEVEATLVVVNAALKPSQIFNLQQFFSGNRQALDGQLGASTSASSAAAESRRDAVDAIEVWDRTRLILEIFRERARSPEARLQVELAQLTYETPLVKETIHLAKKGEHPGFLGGGEYEVNQYYDMMKKRMVRIKRDLEKMRRERGLRRKHRRRGGYHLVSLAGYTNAGKSSLLRALAPAPTVIENRYFSTLSTKTRRAASDKRDILVTDTVGFIEDLPPWLVDAFHSTLEEIAYSDVTLLVLDASDPVEEMARRLRSSLRILWTFDSETADSGNGNERAGSVPVDHALRETRGLTSASHGLAPILVVLNKKDRVTPEELEAKTSQLVADGLLAEDGHVAVSALKKDGLPELYERLYELLPAYDRYEVALPQTPETESLVAWLHADTDVLSLTRGNEVHLRFEAKTSLASTLQERLKAVGATRLEVEEAKDALIENESAEAQEPLDADEGDEVDEKDETDGTDGRSTEVAESEEVEGNADRMENDVPTSTDEARKDVDTARSAAGSDRDDEIQREDKSSEAKPRAGNPWA